MQSQGVRSCAFTVAGNYVRSWTASDRDATAAPVILAIHGRTDSGIVFGPLAQRLSGFNLLAPDAPGHGNTPWTPTAKGLVDATADAVVEILDHLHAQNQLGPTGQITLLGHSCGAYSAALAAIARPRYINAVILEEPPQPRPLDALRRQKIVRWARRLQALPVQQRHSLIDHDVSWSREEYDLWSQSKSDVDLAALARSGKLGHDLGQLLGQLRCPTLLLAGQTAQSEVSPRREAQWRDATAGQLRAVRLDAGHNPRREDLAGYTDAIVDFLGAR